MNIILNWTVLELLVAAGGLWAAVVLLVTCKDRWAFALIAMSIAILILVGVTK